MTNGAIDSMEKIAVQIMIISVWGKLIIFSSVCTANPAHSVKAYILGTMCGCTTSILPHEQLAHVWAFQPIGARNKRHCVCSCWIRYWTQFQIERGKPFMFRTLRGVYIAIQSHAYPQTNRREDGRYPLSANSVTITNPELLSSSETRNYRNMKLKRHFPVSARCQKRRIITLWQLYHHGREHGAEELFAICIIG
jgi:hypothetical protein